MESPVAATLDQALSNQSLSSQALSDLALSDHDLLARARAGDVDALDLLITAVRKAVRRYCRARLSSYSGGVETAEDVTQEVCLAVVDVLPRYRDQRAPFAALVYAIASNKVADAQRRYARTPFHAVAELPERAEPAPKPEQQTLTRFDVAAALALLERLPPPRMRLVVRLYAGGLNAAEVGAIVGLTANAVSVTQHRALARLRRLVDAPRDQRDRSSTDAPHTPPPPWRKTDADSAKPSHCSRVPRKDRSPARSSEAARRSAAR